MAFTRLPGPPGVGGPTVDTVLDPGTVRPGGTLTGRVRLHGGAAPIEIEHIAVELVARVEAEQEGGGSEDVVVFERFTVGGGLRLGEGERQEVPFAVTLPWETPVTELYGRRPGAVLGVRTGPAVAGADHQGDLDPLTVLPLTVLPLPAQEAVLEAFGRLGFGFRSAGLEHGRIGGTGQRLPFRQEIEIAPSPRWAGQVNDIEVTFLASPGGLEVVLEADKRGGALSPGHDALTRFTVPHDGVSHQDWNTVVDDWVRELIEHRASYGSQAAYGYSGAPEGARG